jgi:hypothetical protein
VDMDHEYIVKILNKINAGLEAGWECDMSGAVETAQVRLTALIMRIEEENR